MVAAMDYKLKIQGYNNSIICGDPHLETKDNYCYFLLMLIARYLCAYVFQY